MIDVCKFGQVIRNLVSNALKFTPRGGAVTVTAEPIYVVEGTCFNDESLKELDDQSDLINLETLIKGSLEATPPILSKPSSRNFQKRKSSRVYKEIQSSSLESTKDHVKKMMRISVCDTGSGLSEEDQQGLFTEFKQIDANKQQGGGGSGLGLWGKSLIR